MIGLITSTFPYNKDKVIHATMIDKPMIILPLFCNGFIFFKDYFNLSLFFHNNLSLIPCHRDATQHLHRFNVTDST